MTEEALQEEAGKLLALHTPFDKIYMTTDGQGFSTERYAQDHAKQLGDATVREFSRNPEPTEPTEPELKTNPLKPNPQKIWQK
ncbi:MAG: hypothetical protein Q4G08_04195 [Capnocytophaga sp.]|nr:hypothetical protein [Capnocytophaga sp.]